MFQKGFLLFVLVLDLNLLFISLLFWLALIPSCELWDFQKMTVL